MIKRKIIQIDESKCNGCGQCVGACAEGALQMVNGKAKLVRDDYCDGLGDCLGECPTGALTIEEREAVPFDEKAVEAQQEKNKEVPPLACGCPGNLEQSLEPAICQDSGDQPSQLGNWPVQLKLIKAESPLFQGADLLLAADCTAFAAGAFHRDFLQGKKLIIACPKLDDPDGYLEKLGGLFKKAGLRSFTVLRMEVPCCGGLSRMVKTARMAARSNLPVRVITLNNRGEIVSDETLEEEAA